MTTNLLFFCSDYQVGLTQALTEQAEELNRCDKVTLHAISSQNEMEQGLFKRLNEAAIDLTVVDDLDAHSNFRVLARQIERVIDDKGITHVNVHNNWQLALVAWVKYRKLMPRDFKIIYTIHGYRHNSWWKQYPALLVIGTALLLTADRVISMSSFLSRKFWLVGYKTDCVFYMMNQPRFRRQKNNIEGTPLRMVFPAQFRHGKRQETLVDAVAAYVGKTGDRTIRLTMPGDGPTRQEVAERAKTLGIADLVYMPGKLPLDTVHDLYEQGNIALCASNVETYGRCIAEPFALGRCVVTRPTGVALDIIRDGVNGRLFNTVSDLTDILVDLHEYPEKVEQMAMQAFADRKVFSRDEVLNSYIKAIDKA